MPEPILPLTVMEAYRHMILLAETVAGLAPHHYRKETYTSVLGFLLAAQLSSRADRPAKE